jgi:inositol polyphosphate 1-phosphatase
LNFNCWKIDFVEKLFNYKNSKSIRHLAEIVHTTSDIHLSESCIKSFDRISNDIHIDLSNVGIWIDPVDGTQQYIGGIDGNMDKISGIYVDGLQTAMVLIGCFDINNGLAIIGVINQAFHRKFDDNEYELE